MAVSQFGAVQPPGGGGVKKWSGSPKSGMPASTKINSLESGLSNARAAETVVPFTPVGPPPPKIVGSAPHKKVPPKPAGSPSPERVPPKPVGLAPHERVSPKPVGPAPHERAATKPAESAPGQTAPARLAEPAPLSIQFPSSAITPSRPNTSAHLNIHLDFEGKIEDPKTTGYARVFVYEHNSRGTDILEIHLSTGTVHREDIRSLLNPFEHGSCLTIRRKGLDGMIKVIKIRLANIQAATEARNVLVRRAHLRKTSSAPPHPDILFEGMEFGVIDVSSLLPLDEKPALAATPSEQVATTVEPARHPGSTKSLGEQPAIAVAQPSIVAKPSEQLATPDKPAHLPDSTTKNTKDSTVRVGPGLEKVQESDRPIDHRALAPEEASRMAKPSPGAGTFFSDRNDSLAGAMYDDSNKTAGPAGPNPVATEGSSVLVDLDSEASEEPAHSGVSASMAEFLVLMAPRLEGCATQQPLVDLDSEDAPEEPQQPSAPKLSSVSELEGIEF